MAKRRYSEDLFKDTTMTFGEHLEELRGCLFRAILGLMIGFGVGLYFGNSFVKFIEKPVNDALVDYHLTVTTEKVWDEKTRERLDAAGYHLPKDKNELATLLTEKGFIFEEVHVYPPEIMGLLKQQYPEQFADVPEPKHDPESQSMFDALRPLRIWRSVEEKTGLTSLSAHEAFIVYIKGSLLLGALLASPWIFYQVWSFVAAGLYPHEKRYVHLFLPFSLGLFLTGAATAFFFVFGPVLQFLLYFNITLGITPDIRMNEWWGFVLMLPLGFGVSFQLPLVMLFLERIGIFDVNAYLSKWRIAILVIFVASMLLTPADPTSMMLMAAPLTVLYFGGIALCKWMPRGQSVFDELEE
jgi:sec-independent protein translocase protein TatC